MQRTSRSALRYVRGRGPRIPLSKTTIDAIIDFVASRDIPSSRNAMQDSYGTVTRTLQRSKARWYPCFSADDVDTFSLVEVYDAQLGTDGVPILYVRKATKEADLYAVTEDQELKDNSEGWVRLVDESGGTIVRSGTAIPFMTRVGPEDGETGRVQTQTLSDLICIGSAIQQGTDQFLSIAYRPVQGWYGQVVGNVNGEDAIPQLAVGKVKVPGTDDIRRAWFPFGEATKNDVVWVGRNDTEAGSEEKWVAVIRPCPEDLLS